MVAALGERFKARHRRAAKRDGSRVDLASLVYLSSTRTVGSLIAAQQAPRALVGCLIAMLVVTLTPVARGCADRLATVSELLFPSSLARERSC